MWSILVLVVLATPRRPEKFLQTDQSKLVIRKQLREALFTLWCSSLRTQFLTKELLLLCSRRMFQFSTLLLKAWDLANFTPVYLKTQAYRMDQIP
jgi:hypothetical protein